MRTIFLWLSHRKFFRTLAAKLGFVRRAVMRFVAGETIDAAIRAIKELNAIGITTTLDHLGENVETEADATRAADDYIDVLEAISKNDVKSHVSIKLTALGLDLGDDFCCANVARVIAKAKSIGSFVRIDMEGTPYTERTLAIYRSLRKEFDNLGIVIQAYLYRTEKDIDSLCAEGAKVRLCKGAYKEPADKAFPKKADVDANYIRLTKKLLSAKARAKGTRGAIATHDPKMIEATRQYAAEANVPHDEFEFQMLFGIRRELQRQLASEGYAMRVYVPYGTEWYPYFMRRLAERPANVWFVLSNMFKK
ncbi:MAG TPA: proline dehydrogenase family protein [Anaerolineae bacterium]|nr:proline dehydrogenase family protein [Anaerolineae bacterium]